MSGRHEKTVSIQSKQQGIIEAVWSTPGEHLRKNKILLKRAWNLKIMKSSMLKLWSEFDSLRPQFAKKAVVSVTVHSLVASGFVSRDRKERNFFWQARTDDWSAQIHTVNVLNINFCVWTYSSIGKIHNFWSAKPAWRTACSWKVPPEHKLWRYLDS